MSKTSNKNVLACIRQFLAENARWVTIKGRRVYIDNSGQPHYGVAAKQAASRAGSPAPKTDKKLVQWAKEAGYEGVKSVYPVAKTGYTIIVTDDGAIATNSVDRDQWHSTEKEAVAYAKSASAKAKKLDKSMRYERPGYAD